MSPQVAIASLPLLTDRQARFEAFVEAWRDRAVRTAWRLTGQDQAVAEEVAQDAFLKAQRGLHRFRDESAMATWFFRILVRQAANHRRWSGLRRFYHSDDSPEPQANPSTAPGDPLLRGQIQGALAQLSMRQRTVFTLVYLEGFTLDEAAEIMRCAPGTARSHLHRALKTLRTALAPLHPAEP